MQINTETMAFLIKLSKREDIQHLAGIRQARVGFESGNLEAAMIGLYAVEGLKELVGDGCFALIQRYYGAVITGQIKDAIASVGFAICHSDSGFSYTVGLAKTKPELCLGHMDFDGDDLAHRVLRKIARLDYAYQDTVITFSCGESVILMGAGVASRENARMLFADQWWKAKDYPLLRIFRFKDMVLLDNHGNSRIASSFVNVEGGDLYD
jgi:hypothetical protein